MTDPTDAPKVPELPQLSNAEAAQVPGSVPDPAIAPAQHPTDRPQRGDGSAVPPSWAESDTPPEAQEPQPNESQRGPSGDETDDSGEDGRPG